MTGLFRKRSTHRGMRAAVTVVTAAFVLGGCSLIGAEDAGSSGPAPVEASSGASLEVESQFTRDGTFQSHIAVDGSSGMDFVYTLYPTKSTPRTNEWYPRGKKFFSFTFQAYDLDRGLRDRFDTKREVYLDTMKVTSATVTDNGAATQRPYRLDAKASQVTFDPQAVTTPRGMLITSPKGAFELRNQAIKPTSDDTRGIELTFTAVVFVETRAGSNDFAKRTVKQVVPIAIFESDEATTSQEIPVNAN